MYTVKIQNTIFSVLLSEECPHPACRLYIPYFGSTPTILYFDFDFDHLISLICHVDFIHFLACSDIRQVNIKGVTAGIWKKHASCYAWRPAPAPTGFALWGQHLSQNFHKLYTVRSQYLIKMYMHIQQLFQFQTNFLAARHSGEINGFTVYPPRSMLIVTIYSI